MKGQKKIAGIVIFVLILFVTSCVTSKKITYIHVPNNLAPNNIDQVIINFPFRTNRYAIDLSEDDMLSKWYSVMARRKANSVIRKAKVLVDDEDYFSKGKRYRRFHEILKQQNVDGIINCNMNGFKSYDKGLLGDSASTMESYGSTVIAKREITIKYYDKESKAYRTITKYIKREVPATMYVYNIVVYCSFYDLHRKSFIYKKSYFSESTYCVYSLQSNEFLDNEDDDINYVSSPPSLRNVAIKTSYDVFKDFQNELSPFFQTKKIDFDIIKGYKGYSKIARLIEKKKYKKVYAILKNKVAHTQINRKNLKKIGAMEFNMGCISELLSDLDVARSHYKKAVTYYKNAKHERAFQSIKERIFNQNIIEKHMIYKNTRKIQKSAIY